MRSAVIVIDLSGWIAHLADRARDLSPDVVHVIVQLFQSEDLQRCVGLGKEADQTGGSRRSADHDGCDASVWVVVVMMRE